jgi:hypothetical protein
VIKPGAKEAKGAAAKALEEPVAKKKGSFERRGHLSLVLTHMAPWLSPPHSPLILCLQAFRGHLQRDDQVRPRREAAANGSKEKVVKKKGTSSLVCALASCNLVIVRLQASEGTSKEVIKSSSKEAKEAAAKGSKKKVVKKKGGVSKPWWTQNEGPLPWEMAAAGIALALLLMFFFVVRPSASGLYAGRAAGVLSFPIFGKLPVHESKLPLLKQCRHRSWYSCFVAILAVRRSPKGAVHVRKGLTMHVVCSHCHGGQKPLGMISFSWKKQH